MSFPSLSGSRISHYQVIERLGSGGMGEVYEAHDNKLQRKVALKLFDRECQNDDIRIRRIEREAQAVAALNHPGIVTIYSVENHDGIHFITMELVEGSTLDQIIPRIGLSINDLLPLAVQVADALRVAHSKGVVHRDLKPTNIMVSREGKVKVLDFGLAKLTLASDAFEDTRSTSDPSSSSGTLFGTIPYMSPEQARAEEIGAKSDLFSFGIILYEMCTGKRPFQGESSADVIAAILRDTPKSVREQNRQCPSGLSDIIAKCLEKSPSDRFENAGELHQALCELKSRMDDGSLEEADISIAVLPFSDLSQEKNQQYFCDGLADELINAIANIRGIRVVARTSAFGFRDSQLDAREIGTRLSADVLLDGGIRKAGERVRVSVQLIKVSNGFQLWSGQYDRDLHDIFEIQDQITQNIVQSMEQALQLDSPVKSRLVSRTTNADAYDYFLKGRTFFYLHRRKGLELAMQMFGKAIELDPEFASAYSGIAECCYFIYLYYDGDEECLKRGELASISAVEFGPDLAESHAARGSMYSLQGHHEAAETEFETAIRLGPQHFDAYYLYARDSFVQGNLEKAAFLFRRAAEVDPDDYQSRLLLAQIGDDLGRTQMAQEARIRGIELAEKRLSANPDDVRALYLGANGLIVLGQVEKALEWIKLALSIEPSDSFVLYNVTCVYSVAGQPDLALKYLEKTVEHGLTRRQWIDQDSQLDSIRHLPRFQAIVSRLK